MQTTELKTAFFKCFDFSGKTACVTGAASGIGRQAAMLLSALGADVYAADRDAEGLARLKQEYPALRTVQYDQSELASIEKLVDQAGGADILINNAAMLLYEPILELDWPKLQQVVQVNLIGAIALTRLFGERMVQRRSGTIIMTGSQLTFNGAEYRGVYTAAKAGVTQFIRTAAQEWGPSGVRVNGVAPGRTLTNMNRHLLDDPKAHDEGLQRIPLQRYGNPEDVAHAMVYLASGAASYVTGHTIVVDGGWILL